jgi:hypothetical protein
MAKLKISKGFSNILFLMSVFGTSSIILGFFNVINLGDITIWVLSLMLGTGLLIESQIRLIVQMLKGGLNNKEITHIVTGVTGIVVLIGGIMGLIQGAIPDTLKGILGLAYIVALIMTFIERFV